MSFAWTRRAALGALLFASACSSASDSAAPGTMVADAGPDAPTDAAPITFDFPASLACVGQPGLCATPALDVEITVSAPGTSVTVALEGDYGDASLGADDVALTAGRGTVHLHTGSKPTTFRVMARLASDSTQYAELDVAVSDSGFATLQATADYSGHRPAPELLATVLVGTTCAALARTPPAEPRPWNTAPRNIAFALIVPAGAPLTVDVRIGHYAYGCADVASVPAKTTGTTHITVVDLPMALDNTDLDATFNFTVDADTTAAWASALDTSIQRVSAAFFASGAEGTALLDGVRATITAPADQAQFDTLRAQKGWDATANKWPKLTGTWVHDQAGGWLTAARKDALGPLALHVASGTSAQTAVVTPSSFSGLTAVGAGIETPAPFAWTADPDDTVHLSGAVDLAGTPLVAHLADVHAQATESQATDCPSALAIEIDGAGLAGVLVGTGVSYGTCGASCTADAIRTAINAAWTAASAPAAAGADVVHLTVTASAPGDVGDHAEPVDFAGAWLGQASGKGVPVAFALKGTVSAGPTTPIH